ncbi:MAG TPA: flippase [Candidatus Acidoferrales bacterium]|nr:flippase [Candidatus Acidoferrales bacterium]
MRLEAVSTKDLTPSSPYPLTDHVANSRASLTHRLARGASIYVVWLAAGKGLTVALQIVLGRWLGPASYGLYALGYSVTSLLSWVSVLGVDQGVLRLCAIYRTREQSAKMRSTLCRAVELAAVASVLTAALLVFGSRVIAGLFFTPSFASVLAGFALTLPFVAIIRVAGTFLQSLHDIYRMSVLQLLARPALNIILLVLAIGLGWGLEGAVGAYVLCCVGTAALAAFYLLKKLPRRPSGKAAIERGDPSLMRYSLTLMFSGLSYQVILRAPQVLLGHLSSSAEVGVFSAGASFALGLGFMTSTFLQPAMPMMVELHEARQSEGLQRLYQNSTRWTLAVVAPIFLFLCLFHSEVMRLFGRHFSAAGPILVAMSLGWLVYYGKGPGSALLQMTGRQKLDLANTLGVAALTIVTNYLAIPRYGAMGAALATAGSVAAWALIEYIEMRLLYELSPWSSGARRNIFAALVTAAVTISLRSLLPWELLLMIATCLYAVLYFGLCIETDDRRIVAAALTKLGGLF